MGSRLVEHFAHERPDARKPARSSDDSLNDAIITRFAAASSSATSGERNA
jgi:hypothetical protein